MRRLAVIPLLVLVACGSSRPTLANSNAQPVREPDVMSLTIVRRPVAMDERLGTHGKVFLAIDCWRRA